MAFYTEDLHSGIRIAQVVGLTTTAFFAGKTFAKSFSATPALLHAPAPLLAKQWKTMHDSDKALAPAVVAIGTSVFGYLASREPRNSKAFILYTTSASLLALCVPYTLILAEPIIQKLEQKAQDLASASLTDTAAEAGVRQEDTVHQLVDKWATVNLGRTILTGIAALTATWAAVDKLDIVPATIKLAGGAGRMGH
ncbi:hypothetical protein LTR36_009534 [Oleoguttula mirabilis]|uniref:DUF1772-domain-containing protein n=1 Tax=Oleoguttula mirabilis TaxID=1507867 RepID=A0AAV9JSY2_9PEZI|nr:hypothetical protein LTR36_009534 [Oleoguttula mirabilis]